MNYDYLNEEKKSICNKILNNFNEKKNSTILIYGYKSSCKTIISKYIFEKLKIIPIYYNIFNDSDIYKEIYNFNNNNFNNILNNKKNMYYKGLIIDNLDFISLNTKKKYLKSIIIDNIIKSKIPIILISKKTSNKLLDEIIKEKVNFEKYEIVYSNDEIKNICNKLLNLDKSSIEIVCSKTEYNLKMILNIYSIYSNINKNYKQDLDNNKHKLCKDIEKTDENILYLKYILSINFLKKETNNIFNSLINILQTDQINKIKYYYDKDKVILPLILHENYISLINKNKEIEIESKINCISNISKIISFGDNIETFIYSDQNWILHNTHCFITCILTSFLLKDFIDSDKIDINTLNYSTELNKTSLMNINKKNITNIIQFTNLPKKEIFYLNYLLNYLIHNSIEKIIIILFDYINLNKNQFIKLVDMLLKIDKTYNFCQISIIEKKKIINLLNVIK